MAGPYPLVSSDEFEVPLKHKVLYMRQLCAHRFYFSSLLHASGTPEESKACLCLSTDLTSIIPTSESPFKLLTPSCRFPNECISLKNLCDSSISFLNTLLTPSSRSLVQLLALVWPHHVNRHSNSTAFTNKDCRSLRDLFQLAWFTPASQNCGGHSSQYPIRRKAQV